MILIIGSRAKARVNQARFLFDKAFDIESPVYLGKGDMGKAGFCLDPLAGNSIREQGVPRPGPFLPRIIDNLKQSPLVWRYCPRQTRIICDASHESRVVMEALMSFPWLLPPGSSVTVVKPDVPAVRFQQKRYEEMLEFIKDEMNLRIWFSPDYEGLPLERQSTVEAFWISHSVLNKAITNLPDQAISIVPPLLVFACEEQTRKRLLKNLPAVGFETLVYRPGKALSPWGDVWSGERGRHVLLIWDLDAMACSDTGNSFRYMSEFSSSPVWSIVGLPSLGKGVGDQSNALKGLAKYPFEQMAPPVLIGGEPGEYGVKIQQQKHARMRKAMETWLRQWARHHLAACASSS